MDTEARLSANLQRAYSTYKAQGTTPVVLSNVPRTPLIHQTDSVPEMTQAAPETEKPNLTLPEIARPQSGYPLPPPLVRYERSNTAQKLSWSEDYQARDQGGDIEYEYQVDDAAGIPSLGFFRKTYSYPTNRYGRNGACWRHVQQCTAQGGGNLLYIDGRVKETDCSKYPPFGIIRSKTLMNSRGQRLIPKMKGQNSFNSKARDGFEYWYKEPKANITEPPPAAVRTISGHQYKIKGR